MTLEPWRQSALRSLPAVHEVLAHPVCERLIGTYGQRLVAVAVNRATAALRNEVLGASGPHDIPLSLSGPPAAAVAAVANAAAEQAARLAGPSLRPVINATGVVLHTNLGRAVLPAAAVAAVTTVAGSYSNLELDLRTGQRGSRYAHVEDLLCYLTGAEAALVVNNNAAAVLLALSALAHGREAVVSRGELVEIGGSFRVPDVMRQSGVTLREVGTTNRTHIDDYAAAIGPETALLLKVHASNYRIEGFTAAVSPTELAALGASYGLPVMHDLGSGTLVNFASDGLRDEPTLAESLAAGVSLVTASGDKLLGGPQAGILLGRRDLIERCRRHPLTRALRIDKLALAALAATLRLYVDEATAREQVPTLQMLTVSVEQLQRRAASLARRLRRVLRPLAVPLTVRVRAAAGQAGGGALPGELLPGALVALQLHGLSPQAVVERLRQGEPAVLARVQQGEIWFDPRTLLPGQDKLLAEAVAAAVAGLTA